MQRRTSTALTPPLPTALQVEVTAACNLACAMCLVAYRPPKPIRGASMPLARFEALLDELPDLQRVTLQGLGEPLLAPDFDGFVAAAVERGIEVGFNTNGMLLSSERSARLVAAGVAWVHVSLDGARPETVAAIRRGIDVERVLANLRALVAARAAAGRSRPRLQWNYVLMRRNLAELADAVRLAAEVGVDRLWVQRLAHDFSDVAADEAYVAIRGWTDGELLHAAEVRAARDAAVRVAAEVGLDLRLPAEGDVEIDACAGAGAGAGGEAAAGSGADGAPGSSVPAEAGCDWPWRAAYVGHDGRVQPCCMLMGADRGVLGDLTTSSFAEVWTGPAYRDLRRGLLEDAPPAICRGCSVYRRRF